MLRILCQIIGGILSLVGSIVMILPIPFSLVVGVIILATGMMFLIPTTPAAERAVRKARKRFRWFDRTMTAVTRRAPTPFRRVLRKTEVGAYDW